MNEVKQKLTLDQQVTYQIRVPGKLDECWTDWTSITVSIDRYENGSVVTTLTGSVDQAALHGILRRLYYLDLPIISVICIDLS